jgi:aminopeptidase YwaD
VAPACAQLVPDVLLRDILTEISADNALQHTEALSSRVRYAGSAGFFDAADYAIAQARSYGLQNARIERFETKDPSWDPLEGELDLIEPEHRRLSSLQATSVLVAQFSKDGDVTAEVIDVGQGTAPDDYKGKQVQGKILLADGEPLAVWKAMGDRGAAGVLSAASGVFYGRRTPPNAVLWSRAPTSAMAMMISPDQAAGLRRMMPVKIRMRVRAKRTEPGAIGMVMGEIPGAAPDRDIVMVAHLDHQKPGANDNASGSATLLEALRTLTRLIATGKVPIPRRTIRFWWSTEIRSEREYFRKHPEQVKKILLAVNLDQAGGDRNAENNFIMILSPNWLPSYADDLIQNLAEYVKNQYAPAEYEPSPLLIAPNGGKQSLRTVYWDYAALSDHAAFEAKEVGITAITLAVPSLHLIHTNLDSADRIDPTWLKRSALFMLAPALFAANAGPKEAQAMLEHTFKRSIQRLARAGDVKSQLGIEEKRLDSVLALDPSAATEACKKKLRIVAHTLRNP